MSTRKILLRPVNVPVPHDTIPCVETSLRFDAGTALTQTSAPKSVESFGFVIVVDGSPTIRKILETTLHREHFAVKTFASGREMMRWFLRPDAPAPDVFVLDSRLPKMNGYEIAQRLRANTYFSTSRLLILSEKDRFLDKMRMRTAGAHALLLRPFQIHELVDAVKAQVQRGCSRVQDIQH